MRGNKHSKEHPLTHSFAWARISSVSMSNCLPGNWRKQSLLNSPQICVSSFPLFLPSGSVRELTDFSSAIYAQSVPAFADIYIHTHTCGCIPAKLAIAFLNGKGWLCRKLSSGLHISSLPRPSQLLHTATLHEAQGYWKFIACINHFIEEGRQINSNLISTYCVWLTTIWNWGIFHSL